MERKEDTCKGKDGQEQEEVGGRSEKPHCRALFFTKRNRAGEGKRSRGLFSSRCEMQSSDFIGGRTVEKEAGQERESGEKKTEGAIMGCGYGGAERGRERGREDSRSCHLRRRLLLLIEFCGCGFSSANTFFSSRSQRNPTFLLTVSVQ